MNHGHNSDENEPARPATDGVRNDAPAQHLSVTGMTPSATNVVPHGLGHTPQVVGLNNWGASGHTQVFDSTQGYQDAGGNHLGYDSTNVYVITPAGRTTCQLLVEHGRI